MSLVERLIMGVKSMVPIQKCTVCGRETNVMRHMCTEHPPAAAKKWLKKTCKKANKPCKFQYMPGVEPASVFTGQ